MKTEPELWLSSFLFRTFEFDAWATLPANHECLRLTLSKQRMDVDELDAKLGARFSGLYDGR